MSSQRELDTQRAAPKPTTWAVDTNIPPSKQDELMSSTTSTSDASRIKLELQPLSGNSYKLSKYIAYNESVLPRIKIATILIGEMSSDMKPFGTRRVWGKVLDERDEIVAQWELPHGREKHSTIYGSTHEHMIANIVNNRKIMFAESSVGTVLGPITSFLPPMSFDKDLSPTTPTILHYKQKGTVGLIARASFYPNSILLDHRVHRVELELFDRLPTWRRPALLSFVSFQISKWNLEESNHKRSSVVNSHIEVNEALLPSRNGVISMAA